MLDPHYKLQHCVRNNLDIYYTLMFLVYWKIYFESFILLTGHHIYVVLQLDLKTESQYWKSNNFDDYCSVSMKILYVTGNMRFRDA
jgi:hypothetical protein